MGKELCPTCEKGTLVDKNARGSKWSYRSLRNLPLEIDLMMMTCDQCDERIVGGLHLKIIDLALERSIYKRALEKVRDNCACDTPEVCYDAACEALDSTAPQVGKEE